MSDDGFLEAFPAATPDAGLLAGVDLNLLTPLWALLEEKNVTRAAARVGVTQPAMSHTLRRCRTLLHDDLLVREAGGMQLTPRARRLVEPLERILRAVEDTVLDRAEFDPARTTRTFRISGQSTTLLVVLPRLEKHIGSRAPGVVFRDVGPVPLDRPLLDLRGIDVALISQTVPSDLPRERLYEDRWVAVTSPDDDAEHQGLAFDDFGSRRHVVFDTTPFRSPVPPYQVLDKMGVGYSVRMRVHDFLLVPLMLRGTDLVAVAQERAARILADAGLVSIRPLPFGVPPIHIDMVWNPQLVTDRAATWLHQQLLEAFP